jgi:hypothetical protein
MVPVEHVGLRNLVADDRPFDPHAADHRAPDLDASMSVSQRWWPWAWLGLGAVAIGLSLIPAHAITHVTPIAGRAWFGGTRDHARHQLVVNIGTWAALFVVAATALQWAPRRASVVVSLAGGIALGVASLARTAVLSNDLYRYVWDGKVQAAGIDPYRYAPTAPQLQRLHDSWLWPTASICAGRGKPAGCTLLNRSDVHTIYPPGAQLFFLISHVVLPESWRDRGYELTGLLLALVVAGLVLVLLRRTDRDPRLVALWTLCPAVSLEAVQNAHVDAVAVIAILGALILARRHVLWAAALVAFAGLIKLYPLVLFPAIVQRRRVMAAFVVVGLFVVAYLPYVLNVGSGVGGYLRGYLHQEGYGSGTRFILLRLVGLTGHAASAVAVVIVLAVVALALLRRLGPPDRAALLVFVTVLFVATPGEPWYDLLLVALVAVTGAWQWLGILVGDYLGYLTSELGGHRIELLLPVYGAALLLGVVVTLLRRPRVVATP